MRVLESWKFTESQRLSLIQKGVRRASPRYQPARLWYGRWKDTSTFRPGSAARLSAGRKVNLGASNALVGQRAGSGRAGQAGASSLYTRSTQVRHGMALRGTAAAAVGNRTAQHRAGESFSFNIIVSECGFFFIFIDNVLRLLAKVELRTSLLTHFMFHWYARLVVVRVKNHNHTLKISSYHFQRMWALQGMWYL